MATIYPFRPYYYSADAGALEQLITPCHGFVDSENRRQLLSANPNNIVCMFDAGYDSAHNREQNGMKRSANTFATLIQKRLLIRHRTPALFACFQEFYLPESYEKLVRKNIIGLGDVSPYEDGIVYRHEQTFCGRGEQHVRFLRSVGASIDPVLMLYSDPALAGEHVLDDVAQRRPMLDVCDIDGVRHIVYEIRESQHVKELQEMLSKQTLLIADGHHRYEAALQFKKANPTMHGAQQVLMACTNIHGHGLRTLATHRVVSGLQNVSSREFLRSVPACFTITELQSTGDLKRLLLTPDRDELRIGVMLEDLGIILLKHRRGRDGVVKILHEQLLCEAVVGSGIDEKDTTVAYVRGVEDAASLVRSGAAQIAFFLEPTPVAEVAAKALQGDGLMPQKATDFFPKMLSGLLVRKIEQ